MAQAKVKKRGMMDVLRALRRPKVAVMLALGFASGLPFLLTGNTFGYWLREEGTSLKAIGFLSWVSLAYGLKFLWAPLIDRLDAPIVGRWLGRRRGWMALSQVAVAGALIGMALTGPHAGLTTVGLFAVVVAFASATQDIVIDAWRIEVADDADELGLLTSAVQIGYRVALLAADALILVLAAWVGWQTSYVLFGLVMGIGLAGTLFAPEPVRADAVMAANAAAKPLWTPRGLWDAIVGPFIEFFTAHGAFALLILVTITLYHLSDYVRGPISNPFYHDLGLAKATVGGVRLVALVGTFTGIALGGLSALRFGYFKTLIIGAVLQPIGIALFAGFALWGVTLPSFTAVMILDNFAIGYSGVALVTYMSSLTSLGYTATQYAVMTSALAWTGKFLKGFSGVAVEALQTGRDLMHAYALFYLGAAAIGVPAVILCLFLIRPRAKPEAAAT
ncbi:AmpG family muropeptide MFS transporter [Caulobacter sp. LARHSG274]